MKWFVFKLILFILLSIMLYRERHYLLRVVVGIECLRRLGTSLKLNWMDARDWLYHLQDKRA